MNIGGIILPFEGSIDQAIEMVSLWIESPLHILESRDKSFDERNTTDISLEVYEKFLIINHSDFIDSCIKNTDLWHKNFKASHLNNWVIMFSSHDSGGHYGYALFENSNLRRFIWEQYDGVIYQSGEPLDFETDWINASIFYEHEYQDENEKWQTKEIDEKDLSPSDIEDLKYGNYLKCYYVGTHKNCIAEGDLANYLLSLLTQRYIGFDLNTRPESKKILLTTTTGLEKRSTDQKIQGHELNSSSNFFEKLFRWIGNK